MDKSTFEKRLEQSKKIRKNNHWLYLVMGSILIFSIGLWFGSRLFSSEAGYWMNLFTEGLGILVSVGLIGAINKILADRSLRKSLIVQMRSTDNSTALNAVAELHDRGWTNLRKEDLGGANLQSANLSDFNLQECDLTIANLRHTVLMSTDLRGTCLLQADLTNAILFVDNKFWTISAAKAAVNIWDDVEFSEYLARYNETPESHVKDLNEVSNNVALLNEKTILPDGRRYDDTVDLAFYTDNDFPGGKYKPDKGLKNLRLAMHGFLDTRVEYEYE